MKEKQLQDITALYGRLSRDDEVGGESMSIQSQRAILGQYAKEHGFTNCQFFMDDGYSGTNFDRPAFTEMMELVEQRRVRTIIVKDLSRLGRNYLEVGRYTEVIFPENKVRFIAITDGVDSAAGDNEFAPFKNIINEWYAKDISRKVKSAFKAKALRGEYTGAYPPYAVLKVPQVYTLVEGGRHHVFYGPCKRPSADVKLMAGCVSSLPCLGYGDVSVGSGRALYRDDRLLQLTVEILYIQRAENFLQVTSRPGSLNSLFHFRVLTFVFPIFARVIPPG